jgi:hypothetical protein
MGPGIPTPPVQPGTGVCRSDAGRVIARDLARAITAVAGGEPVPVVAARYDINSTALAAAAQSVTAARIVVGRAGVAPRAVRV